MQVQPDSLGTLLRGLWTHLSARRKRQFGVLLVLILVSALAEVVSLGAVLPFLAVLSAPEQVFAHPLAARVAQLLGLESPGELLLPITIAFISAALVAGAFRMLLLWVSSRLGLATGADISLELYRRTLYQPYRVHVARNSSEVISGITHKVDSLVYGVLQSFLTLVASQILMWAVMLALIAINPVVAILAVSGFAAAYALIAWASRRTVRRNSERIATKHVEIVKAIQEGLGGIRDVLLDGTQSAYCEIYRNADRPFRAAQAQNSFAGQSPRYAMEALGIVLIASLAYGLSRQPGGIGTALPMLGALALGAQRLLPSLQQSYGAWTSLSSSRRTLADTLALLNQPLPEDALEPPPEPLPFNQQIQLVGIRFRYDAKGPWVLDDLRLTIPKGARIGLVGTTGSGKSTALDLIMGLLTPDEGQVLIDGVSLTGRRVRAWQRVIAHVPQSIFLADSTVAENIAFGVPLDSIDMQRVSKAARQAQIADFIEALPAGYLAPVGERGVRLSGGQRQRLGIARALYKQATVLVFDEATSALDNTTEQSVMGAIEALSPHYTMILIAHRLSTVRRCHTIVELEKGRVVAQGTYAQLLARSPSFRRMAQAAEEA